MANSLKKDIQPHRKRNRNQAKGQTKIKKAAPRDLCRIGKQCLLIAVHGVLPQSLTEVPNIWDSADSFTDISKTRIPK